MMTPTWRALNRRGLKRLGALALILALFLPAPALGNGNTTADAPAAPAPVKKSVRRAPVKRTTKKTTTKPKTVKKTPAKPVQTSLERGIALMQAERYEEARPWLLKAVGENRLSAAAWYWYGRYHEMTGQFYQAQYFYTKALERDPTFEPLSRVVTYPGDGSKVPLWDPKRPARVYPVPTEAGGVAVIPPDAPQSRQLPRRPPLDPKLPRVPVYTPPEPGAAPGDGDAWQPSVYVPPTGVQASAAALGSEELPAYVPPASQTGQPAPAPLIQPQPTGTTAYIPPDAPKETGTPRTVKKTAPRKVVKKPAKPQIAPAPEKKPEKPTEEAPEVTPKQEPKVPTPRLGELPPVGQEPPGAVEPAMPPVGQE